MFSVNITISDEVETCLLHDLNGRKGIVDWIQGAINGKANACKIRPETGLLATGHKILQADPNVVSIPKNEQELMSATIVHKAYLNREQREASIKEALG